MSSIMHDWFLPICHTARDRLVPELDIAGRLRMAKGMITGISFFSQLDLVHWEPGSVLS